MDGMTGTARGTGSTLDPTGWAVRWRPLPGEPFRLFCVPHAGGGATAFRRWAAELAPAVEVVALRLPGREARFRQPAHTRLDRLVGELVRDLAPWLGRPHAWLGHSMGAQVAFEACRMLRRLDLGAPSRLVVAGAPAPHLPRRETPVHDAPTADLLDRLQELNGRPSDAATQPALLASVLPMLRADFAVAETYRCRPGAPLDLPITVLGGADDGFASPAELLAWQEHTTYPVEVRTLPGGHFFVHEHVRESVAEVARVLPGQPSPAGHRR